MITEEDYGMTDSQCRDAIADKSDGFWRERWTEYYEQEIALRAYPFKALMLSHRKILIFKEQMKIVIEDCRSKQLTNYPVDVTVPQQ